MVVFILKRVGLALITLWILSVIVFLAGQKLPGDPGRAILGPRDARGRRRARPPAGRRPAAGHPVLGLDHQPRARRHGHLLLVPGADRAVHHHRAGELAQAGAGGVRDVRAAGDPSGVIAALKSARWPDRTISVVGLSATGTARVRVRGVPDRDLRDLAERAAGGRDAAGRRRPVTQVYHLILPAIAIACVLFGYIMRMARAGTIEALDSDYTRTAMLKGLPTLDGDPPPRAAQRAAADDHRGRHPGRLPDRRPGGGRVPVPLPGHRRAHYKAATPRTSRCWRRPC